jgi:rhodanese-related sulfurtransferase
MIQSLTARELEQLLKSPAPPVVLDVREHSELRLAPFPGARHIPLGELTRRSGELDSGRPIVCLCHHGVRSHRAAVFLASCGFETLFNLRGGIDAWSLEVDGSTPRY